MHRRPSFKYFLVAVFALALSLAAALPAMAVERGPVPSHATVNGFDLYGLPEAEARVAISENASLSALPPLVVLAPGKRYELPAKKYLTLNVEAMLGRAYETTSTEASFEITRSVVTSAAPIAAFISKVKKSTDRKSVSSAYYTKGGKLKIKASVQGRSVPRSAAIKAIGAAFRRLATGGQPVTVSLPVTKWSPKVTEKKGLGRAILVDLSQRRLWLYAGSKKIVSYGIAIGMPAYPTPVGNFKIIAKNPRPSWGNPGSDWAKNMPARIAPGPTNPLGVRALYVNVSGIRIHGTHKYWSIGRAASHGCMRMRNSDIVKFYPQVPVGTKVFIVR